jgi:hypothetical protein
MCCSTARLSCHVPILAYACSSVLKLISVGLQSDNSSSSSSSGRKTSL